MKKKLSCRVILAIAMLFFASVNYAQTKPGPERASITRDSVKRNYEEEVSGGTGTINYKQDDQNFKIKIKDDKIIELYIDDKKIAEENFSRYADAINKIVTRLKKDKETAEQDRQQAMIAKQHAKLSQEQAGFMKEQSEQVAIQAQKSMMQADLVKQQAKLAQEQNYLLKNKLAQDALQVQKYKLDAELSQQQAMNDQQLAKKDQADAMHAAEKAAVDTKHAEEDKQILENLLNDLVKEKIIENKDAVSSVELTNNTFTVNGKKQPETLHKKFKEIYLKKKDTKLNFGYRHFSIRND